MCFLSPPEDRREADQSSRPASCSSSRLGVVSKMTIMAREVEILTVKAKIISKEGLHDILTRQNTLRRAIGHSLLAHRQPNHGRHLSQLLELGLGAVHLLQHKLMDVVRSKEAHVHGTAAPLDPRPPDGIANGEMALSIRRALRKHQVRPHRHKPLGILDRVREEARARHALRHRHHHLTSQHRLAVLEPHLRHLAAPVLGRRHRRARQPLPQHHLHARLAHQLLGAVLARIRQRLGAQQLRATVHERDARRGPHQLQLGGHLDADGAAAHDDDAVRRGADGLDVRARLVEVLLLGEGLRHDGPGAAQARGYDEVVVGEGAGRLGAGVEDGGGFGRGVDGGRGAVEGGDFGGGEGWDVGVRYPGFGCVGFICEGERGADEVVYGKGVLDSSRH